MDDADGWLNNLFDENAADGANPPRRLSLILDNNGSSNMDPASSVKAGPGGSKMPPYDWSSSSLASTGGGCDNKDRRGSGGVPTVVTAETPPGLQAISSEDSFREDDDDDIMYSLIEEHTLMEVPSEWLRHDPSLEGSCRDGGRWRAYERFRSAMRRDEDRHQDADTDDADDGAEGESGRQLFKSGRTTLAELALDLACPYPRCIGAYVWPSHTYLPFYDVDVDASSGRVDTLSVMSAIFSPFAVPRAIQVGHRYDLRRLSANHEMIMACWEYRNIDFVGGERQVAEGPWVELCSVEVENGRVERVDASNLTKGTVWNIREWLYGTEGSAKKVIDDLSLMRLVFASTFTPLTEDDDDDDSPDAASLLHRRSIGPTWPRNAFGDVDDGGDGGETDPLDTSKHVEELVMGELDPANVKKTSWLEYEVRRATGTLRPQDEYFCQN